MWNHKNKVITNTEDMPEGTVGFVYEIEHIPTGKKYIGKKSLYSTRNVKIGKRELIKLKEERKAAGIGGRLPIKKKVVKEMDWQNYWGSSKTMNELANTHPADEFRKEILLFADTKKKLTYYEERELYTRGVIESNNEYLNDNISGRHFRRDLYAK